MIGGGMAQLRQFICGDFKIHRQRFARSTACQQAALGATGNVWVRVQNRPDQGGSAARTAADDEGRLTGNIRGVPLPQFTSRPRIIRATATPQQLLESVSNAHDRHTLPGLDDDEQPVKLPTEIPGDSLGAGADAQLLVNPLDVRADRCVAHGEPVGDFFVKQALRQQFEHFLLAR